LGMTHASIRSYGIYAGMACVGLYIVRSIVSSVMMSPVPDTNVTAEAGTLRGMSVAFATAAMRGWRPHMEDAHLVAMLDASVFPDAAVFAVLDGHGGADVSAVASKLLAREMVAIGRAQMREKKATGASLEECLEKALPRLDARLRAGFFGLGHLLPGPLHPFCTVGSTACVAAVDFATREVIVANVGDSRAMLVKNGKCQALSEDHKPENPIETKRIQNAGGRVVKIGPCYRVDGNLNLSRALGDFHLKANAGLPAEKQKVSAFPDMTRTPFVGGPQELLLIGCDGLFEKCSNQDVADIVWSRLKRGMALKQIAKELLLACCAREVRGHPMEMGTDNESVILVKLPAAKFASSCADASEEGLENEKGTAVPSTLPFSDGDSVEVHGLESEAGRALNGQIGIMEGPSDSNNERFNVRLSGGVGEVVNAEKRLQ